MISQVANSGPLSDSTGRAQSSGKKNRGFSYSNHIIAHFLLAYVLPIWLTTAKPAPMLQASAPLAERTRPKMAEHRLPGKHTSIAYGFFPVIPSSDLSC